MPGLHKSKGIIHASWTQPWSWAMGWPLSLSHTDTQTHTHTDRHTQTDTHTPCASAFSWNCSGPYRPQALCSSCMKWSTGTTSALISTTAYPSQPPCTHTHNVLPGYLCCHITTTGIDQDSRMMALGLADTPQWMLLCYYSMLLHSIGGVSPWWMN